MVRIDNMLLNNKCEMHWPSRTIILFCCMWMSYADRFQMFLPLTKCRPDLGPNNHLQLLKYLINPVEICRIKSYIIKYTLNVAALYFEDSGLAFDHRWKGFRAVFTSAQDWKLSSLTCYRKYDIVYYLLQSRLWPVTFEKYEIWGFQFSLEKSMLKLTEKSCGLYC